MTNLAKLAIIFGLIFALVSGLIYVVGLFVNEVTPIVLSSPKAGITCASIVTASGAALSCWKDSAE